MKSQGSLKSVGIIPWGPHKILWFFVSIHPTVADIFHLGPKWWTGRQTDIAIQSHTSCIMVIQEKWGADTCIFWRSSRSSVRSLAPAARMSKCPWTKYRTPNDLWCMIDVCVCVRRKCCMYRTSFVWMYVWVVECWSRVKRYEWYVDKTSPFTIITVEGGMILFKVIISHRCKLSFLMFMVSNQRH